MFFQNRNIFNILFEAIPEGVIIVDDAQTILAANSSAEKMFGYNEKELSNKKLDILIPKKYHTDHKHHFSKFIKPGAKRISTVSSRSHLLSTSFMNEDRSIATVVMNETDQGINYKMYIGMKGFEQYIPAHSIQTIVY